MARFGIGARVRDHDGDEGVITDKRKGERLMMYDDTDYGSIWWSKSNLTPIAHSGELQVGDRVRFVEKYGSANVGDEGEITGFWLVGVDDKGGVCVKANDKEYNCYASRVQKVAPVVDAAWVPKVGDRVRFKIDNPNGGARYGKAGQEVLVRANRAPSDAYGRQVEVADTGCGFPPKAPISALEPVTAAAPATSSVVVKVGDRVWDLREDGTKCNEATVSAVRDDGSFTVDWDDGDSGKHWWSLAEWGGHESVTAPATAPAVATATSEPATPAKVNVGDRVEYTGTFSVFLIGKKGTVTKADNQSRIEVDWDGGPSYGDVMGENLTVLPRSPKFKVGDRVKSNGNHRYDYQIDAVNEDTLDVVVIEADGSRGVTFTGQRQSLFTVISAAPTPVGAPTTESFIVARLTPAGHPRPNARPRVHSTLDSANAEAQRLADRLGDEFAVYQRVSTRTVDAGPVPGFDYKPFDAALAEEWLKTGKGDPAAGMAFRWSASAQGYAFWSRQCDQLTPIGRAILRQWIAKATAGRTTTTEAA